MKPRNFFAELKRRNVYKVAVAYAVVGWLLVQIATQVFPFFEIPNWGLRLIVPLNNSRFSPETFWLVAWSLGGLLVMSFVPSKRIDRVFPIVPPLCLLLAAQVAEFRRGKS